MKKAHLIIIISVLLAGAFAVFTVEGAPAGLHIQSGIAAVGNSPTNLKRITVTFPVAFSSPPIVTANTLQGTDFPGEVSDTFAVSIKSVTNTNAVIQVFRVDRTTGVGWAQNLRLDWIAVSN